MAKKIREVLTQLSESEIEKIREDRLAKIKATSMEIQLGVFVGEEIVRHFLPTLNVDSLQSNNVIEVDPIEKAECERLMDEWWKKRIDKIESADSDDEWKALREYHEMLEEKYLPKEIVCTIHAVNYLDETEFKRGIVNALWQSDMSHYMCSEPEDVDVELDDNAWFTLVTIRRM